LRQVLLLSMVNGVGTLFVQSFLYRRVEDELKGR
jgi:hypothetical protein